MIDTLKLNKALATDLQSAGFLPALRNKAWFPSVSSSSYLFKGTGDFWLGSKVSWCFLASRSFLSLVSYMIKIFLIRYFLQRQRQWNSPCVDQYFYRRHPAGVSVSFSIPPRTLDNLTWHLLVCSSPRWSRYLDGNSLKANKNFQRLKSVILYFAVHGHIDIDM